MRNPQIIDLSSPECKLHKGRSVLGHSCSFTQYLWGILAWHSMFVDWLRKRESSHIGDTVHFPRKLRPGVKWIGDLITGLKWDLIPGFWILCSIRGTHSYPSTPLLTPVPALLHCCAKACEREGTRWIWSCVLQYCGHIVLENAGKISWGCAYVGLRMESELFGLYSKWN